MEDLVDLTLTIIKRIVKDENSVSVKHFPSSNAEEILLEVLVSKDEIGKIIGKNGKMISSIRTVIQAASSLSENKKVNINVDSY